MAFFVTTCSYKMGSLVPTADTLHVATVNPSMTNLSTKAAESPENASAASFISQIGC
jgi:hypothetical protein